MMVEVRCFWVTFKSFKMLGKVSTILLRLSEVWFGRSGQLVKKTKLQKAGYSSANCIIVSCRSFRVLTKALFVYI